MKLLIVEDNPADASLLELAFRNIPDVSIIRCDTRAMALAKLTPDVDAIILDIHLPDSNGPMCIKDFRFDEGPAVIAYTGILEDNILLTCLSLGADDAIFKGDLPNDRLVRSVFQTIAKHRLCRQLFVKLRKLTDEQSELRDIFFRSKAQTST